MIQPDTDRKIYASHLIGGDGVDIVFQPDAPKYRTTQMSCPEALAFAEEIIREVGRSLDWKPNG